MINSWLDTMPASYIDRPDATILAKIVRAVSNQVYPTLGATLLGLNAFL